jgi:regulator of protease activity HflC (stomatin/prohibitin superfamily)
MIREKQMSAASGWAMLGFLLPMLVFLVTLIVLEARRGPDAAAWRVVAYALALAVDGVCLGGLFVVNPNEGQVLQLFGKYVGTVKEPGLRWANPFYTKRRISQRVRNFEGQHLKVNDIEGNPIEIAAVVVWKVVETAEACFEVDNYENFVHVQSEAALRNLATSYPYDAHDDKVTSLRGQTAAVAEHLKKEIQERLEKAGVQVIEARISHLAYAPEIAAAMLQRQQAGAIIAARTRIVEGAVGMVEMALERLSQKEILKLDEERRATMVSNLLIVLCGERGAQPVINTGSLYQ